MTSATATKTDIAPGPLRLDVLGGPPSTRHALALARIQGHGSSDALIPRGMFGALDEANEAFLRAREHLGRRLDDVIGQARLFAAEDRARTAAVEAAAAKQQDPPPDERTPLDERQAIGQELLAQAWAAVLVLADRLNDIVATCRDHEKAWLTELRGQLPVLREKVTEAQKVLADCQLQERKLAATGTWLMRLADDEGGFAVSPLVVPESIPPGARGLIDAEANLARPWHRGRDWNAGEGAPSRPARSSRPPAHQLEPPGEDEPGVRMTGAGVGVVIGE